MTGTRYIKRLAAGLACAAVAASVTTAPALAARHASVVPSAVSSTTVSFDFSNVKPSRAMLSLSKDRSYASKLTDGLKRRHKFNVAGLKPDTAYNCIIKLFYRPGKPVPLKCNFKTKKRSAGKVSVRGNKLLLDGRPFFPVLARGLKCPTADFRDFILGIGADVLVDATGCFGGPTTWTPFLHELLEGKLWVAQARFPSYEEYLRELPELLTWSPAIRFNGELIFGSCNNSADDKLMLSYYERFRAKALSHPTVFQVDISQPWNDRGRPNCFNPQSLESMIVEAIIAGAGGLEVKSTLLWNEQVGASYKRGLESAITGLSNKLATIGPVVVSGQNFTATSSEKHVVLQGKRYSGVMYIFAVNTNRHAAASTTFQLPRTAGPVAHAVWRGVSFKVVGGKFRDSIPAGQWRLYVVPPKM